jgi:hypothetical protein
VALGNASIVALMRRLRGGLEFPGLERSSDRFRSPRLFSSPRGKWLHFGAIAQSKIKDLRVIENEKTGNN